MMNLSFLYYFAAAMLGHFVGDYLLQDQWQAINKSKKGWLGHYACTVHVTLYTLAIALFTGWHPLFLLTVAVPHWIIDRWSLATYWLRLKNGYWMHEIEKAPGEFDSAWKIAFAAPVYIFNDNTMHWVCLWFTVVYFFG